MTAVRYEHRLIVEMIDLDGRPYVATWQNDPDGPEAAVRVTRNAHPARTIWNQLRQGKHPDGIRCSLEGWAGLRVSPVQVYARWARNEGWGPWTPTATLEGTREILHGTFKPTPPPTDDQERTP